MRVALKKNISFCAVIGNATLLVTDSRLLLMSRSADALRAKRRTRDATRVDLERGGAGERDARNR